MLYQKNLKKLIAFSSIENMGLLLIGIGVASPLAIFWAVVHMLAHSLTKASLFLSAGILHRQYRSHDPGADDRIVDVFDLQPSAAWGVIIGTLAIAGGTAVPPHLLHQVLPARPGGDRLPPLAPCGDAAADPGRGRGGWRGS